MRVKKQNITLKADPKKVVIQFLHMKNQRTISLLKRLLPLGNEEVESKLSEIITEFSARHKYFERDIYKNFEKIKRFIPEAGSLTERKKLLIGAYFSKEYSIESAALFNPSIIPHPDQNGTENGELKFIMSLRATGEGHISSIEFREGFITGNGDVRLSPDTRHKVLPEVDKDLYRGKKKKKFKNISFIHSKFNEPTDSDYRCRFDEQSSISERILFPVSKSERMGMEDARFVRFVDESGVKYYATYTAYDGRKFRSQILETTDFQTFDVGRLHGKMIKDKGKAIFPKKINGKYFITSRQDGENLYMMESDNLYDWNKAEKILSPSEWWDFVQLGNCGSPIETEKGWLLITHAVGPFRKYVMSAILLDLDNPYKVIGKLNEPLIEPIEDEREGYVPNVVYSCGSLVHNDNLIIPYAMSDSACGFAKIELIQLLQKFL